MTEKQVAKAATLYFDKNMSLADIAKKYKTYPKKIERALKRAGHQLRSRSEAQKDRLASGKAKHPTEGTQLAPETREKISDALHESWQQIDSETRQARSDAARDRLNNREDRDEFIDKGLKAIRETAGKGSSTEHYMANALNEAGFPVLQHQTHQIENDKMHLDILLEKLKIAIEIDGPAHYEPLWGEESLKKSQKRDQAKNGLLLKNGYHVIRVKLPSNVTQYFTRQITKNVIEKVEEIRDKEPKPSLNFIEL